jgi:hypothetical protein
MESRKEISDKRNALYVIRNPVEYLKHESTKMNELESYSTIVNLLKNIEDKQTKRMDSMPIGLRYEGTFYIPSNYNIKNPAIKIEGSAFMAENLMTMTWKIEKSVGDVHNPYGFSRNIFTDPQLIQPIKKEKATHVYKEKHGFTKPYNTFIRKLLK